MNTSFRQWISTRTPHVLAGLALAAIVSIVVMTAATTPALAATTSPSTTVAATTTATATASTTTPATTTPATTTPATTTPATTTPAPTSAPVVSPATTTPIVPLGSAATYLVLGQGTVTSTGTTVVSGDLGVGAGSALVGFPPGLVGGDTHLGDTAAGQALADAKAAFDRAAGLTPTGPLTAAAGQTFTAGVFHTGLAVALAGTVTLDAQNNPDAVFIFQVGGALSTAANSQIVLTNGALASHVFWQAAGAISLGATSVFVGTMLSAAAISTGAGTRISGRALSQSTVTLDNNTYTFTDAAPPQMSIDGGDRSFSRGYTPTLTGTVTTSVTTTATVIVTVAGQTLNATVAGGSGAWSVTTAPITDGSYRLRATVTDPVGNRASATQVFIVGTNGGPVGLGTAVTYAVFGGGGVTSTGNTVVAGDLGTSPANTITGFLPGIIGGDTHLNDPAAKQARTDLDAAYKDATGRIPTGTLTAAAGQTFTAGVFHTGAALALTGTVTLDAQNNPDAVFIFQVGGALSTAAGGQVVLANGALASHVFWQATGAISLGAGSVFAGTMLSAAAISTGAGTQISGRALSQSTVTLANNTYTFTSAAPPQMSIDGGDRSFSRGYTPTLTGTVTTSVTSDATVVVTLAGQTLTATVPKGSGAWSVTSAVITDGSYTVRASVTDPVGNRASATQVIIVGTNGGMVGLGTAVSYTVFGGDGVSSTGNNVIAGDLGTSPATTITGFPPGVIGGDTHLNDAAAIQARTDLDTAYKDATGRIPTGPLTAAAGQTFTAGVFHTDAALALTGTVTLDAQNNPDAVFIFQVGGAFSTAAGGHIVLANGALASHVFWQVVGAISLGASSTFVGTMLSAAAISTGADSRISGRALSQSTVTLANNTTDTFTDAAPPHMSIDGGDRSFCPGVTPTLTGTVTTSVTSDATVIVTLAGQTMTATVAGGSGAWRVTTTPIVDGVYTVRATVTDPVGNRASATQAIIVGRNAGLVPLGTAVSYTVLGGDGVTSTGNTVLTGDLGTSPASTITGFGPGTISGGTHLNDAAAKQARTDFDAAYAAAQGRIPTGPLAVADGSTVTAGVFHTSAAVALTGTLTLDAQHNPDAVFIFQVGGAFSTAANSQVVLTNGALASHVFWQVAGAISLGADASFAGSLLGGAAVTVGAGGTIDGRALGVGVVTLGENTITVPSGSLTINVPTATANLGTVHDSPSGETVYGLLGRVSVSDTRGRPVGTGWTASVTSGPFTPNVTGSSIPASAVSYNAGTVTHSGTATYTTPSRSDLTSYQPVVSTDAVGANADWNPTITVAVPGNATAATYTTTITHSVA